MDDHFTDSMNADIAFNKFKGNPLHIGFDDESYIPEAPLKSISDDDSHIANSGDFISDSAALLLWAKVMRVVVYGLIGLCLVSSILRTIFPERQTPTTYAAAEKVKSNDEKAKMDKFWKGNAKGWAMSPAKAEAAGQRVLAKK